MTTQNIDTQAEIQKANRLEKSFIFCVFAFQLLFILVAIYVVYSCTPKGSDVHGNVRIQNEGHPTRSRLHSDTYPD